MALTSLIQREILYIRGLQIFLGKPFDILYFFLFVSTTHVLYVAIHKLGTSPIFGIFGPFLVTNLVYGMISPLADPPLPYMWVMSFMNGPYE